MFGTAFGQQNDTDRSEQYQGQDHARMVAGDRRNSTVAARPGAGVDHRRVNAGGSCLEHAEAGSAARKHCRRPPQKWRWRMRASRGEMTVLRADVGAGPPKEPLAGACRYVLMTVS